MPMTTSVTLAQKLETAKKAAASAGEIIMQHFGPIQQSKTKSNENDLVTHVDLASDEIIRRILGEAFPSDTLITEETHVEGDDFDLTQAWIIDPIDGTTNFAHGFPHFAVSIGYVEQGQIQIGLVLDPFKNELFTAIRGEGAQLNGKPIAVSPVDNLKRSLLATGFPYDLYGDTTAKNLDLHTCFLRQAHGIRRPGAAALDLVYVAAGRLDGFWEFQLSPWDVAGGMLIVEEAGGTITGFGGEAVDLSQRKIDIVGSNGHIHSTMLSITQGEAS